MVLIMSVSEVLSFIDQVVLQYTGKHLDDVQKAVVEGTWQRQTYEDIAQQYNFNRNHVGDVGADLWHLLSEVLKEDIKKTNLRSTIERFLLNESPIILQSHFANNKNSFNICNHSEQETNPADKDKQHSSFHDLVTAPQVLNFYNRQAELDTLAEWVFQQHIRLISVLGLPGIGKSALVKRFIDLNLENFEIVIWKNLIFPKMLDSFVCEILNTCHQYSLDNASDSLQKLTTLITQKKALIVIDNLQNLFMPKELTGQYQPLYYNYQSWIKQIGETDHQSTIILISQEQSPEMQCLDPELYSIRCLQLTGLDQLEFLKSQELKDINNLSKLLTLYQGNPYYLMEITRLIQDLFEGSIEDFLAEDQPIISQSMRLQFQQLFNRLSPIEQTMVKSLSEFTEPITRETLKATLSLSSTDFINALESLLKRYLITKTKIEKNFFFLTPVFSKFLQSLKL